MLLLSVHAQKIRSRIRFLIHHGLILLVIVLGTWAVANYPASSTTMIQKIVHCVPR